MGEVRERPSDQPLVPQFGQLPAIKYGDFVLFESRAIVRYLDAVFSAKSGKSLALKDAESHALAEQWISVDHDNVQPVLKTVVAEKNHWFSQVTNEEVVKTYFQKAAGVFDVLEGHLAAKKTKYFVGDELSIVEVSFLPYFAQYYNLGGEFAKQIESRPHLAAWWKLTSSNAHWNAILPKAN